MPYTVKKDDWGLEDPSGKNDEDLKEDNLKDLL